MYNFIIYIFLCIIFLYNYNYASCPRLLVTIINGRFLKLFRDENRNIARMSKLYDN